MLYLGIYFVLISIVSIVVTVLDKKFSKQENRRRVPERVLLLLGVLGGALAMYITMRYIHHKTRKTKFMYGLPVMFFLHALLLLLFIYMAKVF